MDVSKLNENVKRVAYCGGMDPKDYSATKDLFPGLPLEAYQNYAKTYEAVVNDECEVAVLPFDNSVTGEVGRVLDLIFEGDLNIIHTFEMPSGGETQRYAVLSKKECDQDDDRPGFMLMFTVSDETGSLAKAINVISDHGYNMRIMRSRPMKGLAWKYYFYVEARGHVSDENGRAMMAELEKHCKAVKVVGEYTIVD